MFSICFLAHRADQDPQAFFFYSQNPGNFPPGVTYYTSEGTMEITFTDAVYVPVKFEQEISVAEGAKTDDIDVAVN